MTRRRAIDVEPRERVERELQHRHRVLGGARDVVVAHARQPVAAARLRRLVRDLLHLVADALEVVDDLADRQHHPQVDRRRLPLGDDLRALLVDADLQLVDRRLVGADGVEQARSRRPAPSASIARVSCFSTMPPIDSTPERIASISASNCLFVWSLMSIPPGSLAEAAGDVVLGFLARGLAGRSGRSRRTRSARPGTCTR